jgi:hypothetical protein
MIERNFCLFYRAKSQIFYRKLKRVDIKDLICYNNSVRRLCLDFFHKLPSAETCRGVIQKLWEENYFTQPRGLDEVHSELARRGFHYDPTAVAHALVELVKDGILTRLGKARRYQYAQKRPPV